MAALRSSASDFFTSIDDLPEELLLNIFEKLSCRSAVACMVASKRWKTLISNPQFAHPLQRNHHQDTATLFFHYWKSSGRIHLQLRSSDPILESYGNNGYELLSFLPCYKTLSNKPPVRVEACFNDLLVCRNEVVWPRVYYICNPFTKQWLELPPAPELIQEEPKVGFVCHPNSCDDEKKGCITDTRYTYKVILVSNISILDGINVAIYCSKRGTWSLSKVCEPWSFPYYGIVPRNNGIVYWLSLRFRVVSFNLMNEKVDFIDLPVSHDTLSFLCMGVCRGRIKVLEVTNPYIGDQPLKGFRVWELRDHREKTWKWRLEHETQRIGYAVQEFLVEHGAKIGGGELVDSVKVMGFDPCKESAVYLVYSSLVLLSYDFKTGIFKFVCEDSRREGILDLLWPTDFFPLSHP